MYKIVLQDILQAADHVLMEEGQNGENFAHHHHPKSSCSYILPIGVRQPANIYSREQLAGLNATCQFLEGPVVDTKNRYD